MEILKDHRNIKQNRVRHLYYEHYYGDANPNMINQQQQISCKIIGRVIREHGWTLKKSEYRNINQNGMEGYNCLRSIAHLHPMCIVDIDESGTDIDDFGSSNGYSPIGEKYIRTQFVVRGKHYTIIAAVTPHGFICHRIFDGPVNDEAFVEFLEFLLPYVEPNQYGILDNASIHRTVDTRTKLEEVFNGRYRFCAPYSPHLKPIEKCFKLVKGWIEGMEMTNPEQYDDPIMLINAAFDQFSVGRQHANSIRGCWNIYFQLHTNFLNNEL